MISTYSRSAFQILTYALACLATDFDGSRVEGATIAPAMNAAEIKRGLQTHDRALFIKAGWIRDPYLTLGPGGYYYLTGTTPLPDDGRQQTDPYNTGLGDGSIVGWKMQVWRSVDLIAWESLGAPFTLKDGVWFKERPERFGRVLEREWRLWAPELHWIGDRWAVVHTSPSPVAGANLVLSAGKDLQGPWTSPMGAAIGQRHDPSLFHDDDGTWWMIWGATTIAPLKPDFSGFVAEPKEIGPSGATSKMGHEGCLIRKIGDKYVLFGTGWSTGRMRKGSYNLYYALADKVAGPYGPRKFAGRFLGHGTPFQDKQGRWWCTAFFNANVPPIDSEGIMEKDLRDNAYSINNQGVTIVPMDVQIDSDGTPEIRAKDPRYASPGPDESQQFPEFLHSTGVSAPAPAAGAAE
ncbi:MAG TPA: family 43 glycosylhydrolase [Lacipirellula sp.]